MSSRRGPPKHQNSYAWKPNAGVKINEKEVGGKLRPYSEITGVCPRCKEQIDWKRRYGKYKPLTEPAKWYVLFRIIMGFCGFLFIYGLVFGSQLCSKRNVRQAYHNLCSGCAKEQKVCAKCRCRVNQIVGRDSAEVEEEQKMLEEAIKNARERDRRTLLRAMDKNSSKSSSKTTTNKENGRVGEIFPSTSLEQYAKLGRKDDGNHGDPYDSGNDDINDHSDDENDGQEDENEDREDDEDDKEEPSA
ncbi:zinc finger protein 330-like protein isoform X2 [Gossypium australe]|uniref:Zinc finger protein 330-like protein isoform X2 n=1 Tax=Gossypium australe TaxID=47621 RepID=A0A5B6UMQ0_9ROSI|nr:zinc finger protein 330-like protein isoform X2 [Gossypium australe]